MSDPKADKKAAKAAKKRAREEAATTTATRVSPRLQPAAAPKAAVPPLEPILEEKKAKKKKKDKDGSDDEKAAKKAAKKEKRKADEAGDAPAKKKKKSKDGTAAPAPAEAATTKRVSPRLHATSSAPALPELSLSGLAEPAGILSPDAYRKENSITGSVALPPPVQSFADSPFDPRLKAALAAAGFKSPSAIQAQSWPVALSGMDLVSVAKTGSGKTVGFLLPAFSAALPQLPLKMGQGPLALVMAPVRELAQQIQVEAERFGGAVGIKSVCVYGGAPKGPQIGALSRGRPVIVVGTPGRLNDLLALSNPPVFNLNSCGYLVLDEADRMLDMGFEPQIKSVVAKLPSARQTLFFTATWPREVKGMAASYLKNDAVQIFVGGADNKLVANKAVTQKFVELQDAEKPAELKKVIDEAGPEAKVMVFCNMKRDCERLLQEQRKLGRGTCAIHGDKEQWEREQALHSFTSGRCPIMFATDVAARGLDVRGVALVVNYDLPTGDDGVESYVHRIGRTGRAGATGLAVSFWNAKTEKRHAPQYLQLLRDAGQEVCARTTTFDARAKGHALLVCATLSLSDTPCCSLLSSVCVLLLCRCPTLSRSPR